MTEDKQVMYDLRITYGGPFRVEDFYAEIDKWIRENGFEKEPKKKSEHITKHGKKIEWSIEIFRDLDDLHKEVIVLRALMENIKEIVIQRDGKKIRVNSGDALVSIDGFIQSFIHGSFWQVKPLYYFIRTLIDRYVYNFWIFKWEGVVASDCHKLFKNVRAFFNVERYKYE